MFLSKYNFLKQYVQKLPSYIKDSTHLINKISTLKELPNDSQLLQIWKPFTLTGFVYRRGPNLFNKLVQANIKACPKLTFLASLKKGNYPLGNCAQCWSTCITSIFRHTRSGKRFSVKGFITCSYLFIKMLMCSIQEYKPRAC